MAACEVFGTKKYDQGTVHMWPRSGAAAAIDLGDDYLVVSVWGFVYTGAQPSPAFSRPCLEPKPKAGRGIDHRFRWTARLRAASTSSRGCRSCFGGYKPNAQTYQCQRDLVAPGQHLFAQENCRQQGPENRHEEVVYRARAHAVVLEQCPQRLKATADSRATYTSRLADAWRQPCNEPPASAPTITSAAPPRAN